MCLKFLKCLKWPSAQVPKCISDLSAQVLKCIKCPDDQVTKRSGTVIILSILNAHEPKCLKCPSAKLPKYLSAFWKCPRLNCFKCSSFKVLKSLKCSSALQLAKCLKYQSAQVLKSQRVDCQCTLNTRAPFNCQSVLGAQVAKWHTYELQLFLQQRIWETVVENSISLLEGFFIYQKRRLRIL